MEKDEEITTVQQYLLKILPYQQRAFAQIHRFGSERPALLFRGQKSDQLLIAKIGQFVEKKHITSPLAFERERFAHMKRRLNVHGYSDWDIVALAQHHGVATRFLDWTSNSLTALWFSLSSRPVDLHENNQAEKDCKSDVWILETTESDFDIPEDERSPIPDEKGSRTVIFTPRLIDSRIYGQDSYLMRQVYEYCGPKTMDNFRIRAVNENPTFKGRLHPIKLPKEFGIRSKLLTELEGYGYTSHTLVPGGDDWKWLSDECDSLAEYFTNTMNKNRKDK